MTSKHSIIRFTGGMGLAMAVRSVHDNADADEYPGKAASDWVILARRSEDFGKLVEDKRWQPTKDDPVVGVWTDDYSNLLSVFTELRGSKDDD